MNGPGKSFSSSKPLKPSSISKFSPTGGADENDLNSDQLASNLQSPDKTSTKKHFMSPNISAASEAAVPRKKILAERNEASIFSESQVENFPGFASSLQESPLCSSISESDDEKPYDPLTNYLSPRPKFLRYNPNRRREIFLRPKNGTGESKNGFGVKRSVSFDSQRITDEVGSSSDAINSSASSSEENFVKLDDEKINKGEDDESDEEIEEFEEERSGFFKGVLKFLAVLVVLFLSTIHISSMNSATRSPSLQDIWNLKSDYHKIPNFIFEAVNLKIFEGGNQSLIRGGEKQVGFIAADQRATNQFVRFEREEMIEDDGGRGVVGRTNHFVEVAGLQSGQSENDCDSEMEKTEEKVSDLLSQTVIAESEVAYNHELEDKGEAFDQLQRTENVESEDVGDQPTEAREKSPFMPDLVVSWDLGFTVSFSDKENHSKSSDDNGDHNTQDNVISDVLAREEDEFDDELRTVEEFGNSASDEIVIPLRMGRENTKSDATNAEMEVNLEDDLTKQPKAESFTKAFTVLSIFFMFIASSLSIFHLRSRRNPPKDVLPKDKSISGPVKSEKINPALAVNVEQEQQFEKLVSYVNASSSLIGSIEESMKESYQSQAPTVELLAEFAFGEISSTTKNCGVKSDMMGIEANNHSAPQEKRQRTNSGVISSQPQPSISDFSATDSPSCGSFTAEKKTKKKEEGKDGEVRMLITTPVRRSSRIRNRSVLSP